MGEQNLEGKWHPNLVQGTEEAWLKGYDCGVQETGGLPGIESHN
jgi:hypothetical protein